MKYNVRVVRTTTDVGYVAIEANSATDAVRKYYHPSTCEDVIFDADIDWEYGDPEYTCEVKEGRQEWD